MRTEKLQTEVNQEAVFQIIGCRDDSPVYDTVREAYKELLPEVLAGASGECIFDFGELTEEDATEQYPAGTQVVYVISTVGRALSDLSTELFAKGDYLKGALVDAMADSCLFELEQQWKELLKQFCREHHVGIRKRLEAPEDLPMTVQKTAFEVLHAGEELGLAITSGFMYDPMKSACQVFVVSEDTCQFHADHDCRNCPAADCRLRRISSVEITVHSAKKTQIILCEEKETILEAYQRQAEAVTAVCGGKGTCGKCRIRLLGGTLPVTEADRRVFSEQELADGYRLSCRAVPTENCSVELCFAEEEGFHAVDTFVGTGNEGKAEGGRTDGGLGIAVDIGTTTLAAQLVDRSDGRILQSVSSINHQRSFGADVISRIEASVAGKGGELRQRIRADLQKLIRKLIEQSGISAGEIEQVIIAGNTTMGHLLMGYSCETLGVFPFTPVNIGTIRGSFEAIIGSELSGEEVPQCEVILLPGISTYVGGDIASGLYACGFDGNTQVNLLVDLGTNGEMAIGSRERILVTSTAAGPAFEGGNISCGTGSIPGAICHVTIQDNRRTSIETIRHQPPVGICGTGVIEITAELLRQQLIDATGRMEEAYFEEGFPIAITPEGHEISFTQKDVREMQLAKSAVRAGVETLIRRYGIGYEDIDHVYLAGGMGFQMNREAAAAIGLLPPELLGKIIAVGNSSLAGAVQALCKDTWQETMEHVVSVSREIALANDPDFNQYYMTHMMFEEKNTF
ncbi:MAG: ASKHA domain-containing protein [Lachnospiraceae bacterium]|nr:ASKHA domain-containing protein [Lachnospiraceae bacterium]